jgi:site-specific DNA recombinase
MNLNGITKTKRSRCAIYTRKSSEEGLEMEFNSLDAQREACEAYITSQKAEGWALIRDRYDDGGFSGGTLDRPALKQLIQDVEAGLIDVIVVYKIDRLSRSLMDFARLVEVLDRNNVTFVSVTQSFNTTTSMGRLTLNILLSFAQFEREVIGERIRDKFAASRKRGMWMGGYVPMGYDVKDRKLVINEAEAGTVKMIYERFLEVGSASVLARALQGEGVKNKQGNRIDKGFIYKLINNRVYIGEAVHKGTAYPGEHQALIDRALWDRVHAVLKISPRERGAKTRNKSEALLKGLIFTQSGVAMSPTFARKGERLYHYYVSQDLIKNRIFAQNSGPMRLPAAMVEGAVINQVRQLIKGPEIVAHVLAVLRQEGVKANEKGVIASLSRFDEFWPSLLPVEQARIVRLLVERITVRPEGLQVDLNKIGLMTLVSDLAIPPRKEAAA